VNGEGRGLPGKFHCNLGGRGESPIRKSALNKEREMEKGLKLVSLEKGVVELQSRHILD